MNTIKLTSAELLIVMKSLRYLIIDKETNKTDMILAEDFIKNLFNQYKWKRIKYGDNIMNDEQALLILRRLFNEQPVYARDAAMALMIVSCSLRDDITMDDLKEFVLYGKRPWEDRRDIKINMDKLLRNCYEDKI